MYEKGKCLYCGKDVSHFDKNHVICRECLIKIIFSQDELNKKEFKYEYKDLN